MASTATDRFAAHALDLFALLGAPVVARRMFGALGFYAGGLFFAIGDQDEGRLYLKVDDLCRAAFEAAGGQPFCYAMPGKGVMTMAYLTPPDGALEDPEEMRPWARLALEAARRAAAAKAAKARPKATKPNAEKPNAATPKAGRSATAAPAARPRPGAAGSASRSGRGRRRGGPSA
jgi:DNA transformation protein and related proteins